MTFIQYIVNVLPGIWTVILPLFVFFCFLNYSKGRLELPPGPRGLPIVGVAPFLGPRPEVTFAKWARKHGDVIGFKMGQVYTVVLSSHGAMQDAFGKYRQYFSHRPNSHMIIDVLKKRGIGFQDYTPDYVRERKFTTTTLHKLGFGKPTIEERIIEEATHFLKEFGDQDFELNDAFKEKLCFSMANIVAQATVGKRFDYQDPDITTLTKGWLDFFHKGSLAYFATTMLPFVKHVPSIREMVKFVKTGMERIHHVIEKEITEHESTLDESRTRDFIDEYLIELKKQSSPNNDEPFSKDMLICIVRDFFGAGMETTSIVIIFSFLVLANRPEAMKRIHDEIDVVIGSKQPPRLELRKSMPYFHAFIIELLRCRTPAPLCLPHCTSENVNFRGFFIPKGTTVFPNLYAIHDDPGLWPEPKHFDPERHLDSTGKVNVSKHFVPFGIGSRMCIGWRIAEMELFIFLASIFRRYDIVPKPDKTGRRPYIQDDADKSGMSIFIPNSTPVTFVRRQA